MGCLAFFEILRDIAIVVATAGVLAIPFALWLFAGKRERRRATVDLIIALATAPEIVERLERLHKYRRYEESHSDGAANSGATPNPYSEWPDGLLFDTATVLNCYESACVATISGLVYETVLMDTSDAIILAMRDVVLARYSRITGIDAVKQYPHIVQLADRWERGRSARKASLLRRISNGLVPGRQKRPAKTSS